MEKRGQEEQQEGKQVQVVPKWRRERPAEDVAEPGRLPERVIVREVWEDNGRDRGWAKAKFKVVGESQE